MQAGKASGEPVLTEAQRECLKASVNTMVSAGAGSGKTFLLVKKIGSILTSRDPNGGFVGLENLLALTFTRKAAGEMRTRVYLELLGRLESTGDETLRRHLARIRESFLAAGISTIHGFSSSLIRNHPVAANVDPDFEIFDEAPQAVRIRSAVAMTLNDLWGQDDERLQALLGVISLDQLKKILVKLVSNPIELRDLVRTYRETDLDALLQEIRDSKKREFDGLVHQEPGLLQGIDETMEKLRHKMNDPKSKTPVREKAERLLYEFWNPLKELVLEGPRGCVSNAAFESLEAKRKEIGSLNKIGLPPGKTLERLREAMFPWFGSMEREMESIEWTRALLGVAELALERFEREKARLGMLTNDDLLLKAGDLCHSQTRSARGAVSHFLVDEFQDTDPLQWEMILRLASGDGDGPENLFLVGDSKQAIYGFRGADHTVTETARQVLKSTTGTAFGDHVLDDNFRSLTAPLFFTNELFSRVFSTEADPANPYAVVHQPLNAKRPDARPGKDSSVTALLAYERSKDNDWVTEAACVTRLLKRVVEGEEDLFPGIPELIREGKPAVAILFRAHDHMEPYVDHLLAAGIPFSVYHGRTFFDAPEIRSLLALLSWLARPQDDVALASVLRSPFVGWTDEMLTIATREAGSYDVPLMEKLAHAAAPDSSSPVHAGAVRAWDLLQELRRLSRHLSLSETLRRAMDVTMAPLIFGFGHRGARADANVEKFLSMVREMEAVEGAGPLTILEGIEELMSEGHGEAEAEAPGEDGASIQLMTIHAAKGLEFPFVILANCCRGINRGFRDFSLRMTLPADREGGMTRRLTLAAIDYPDGQGDGELASTILKGFCKEDHSVQEKEEKKRLLYVALTRARDHLLLPIPFAMKTKAKGKKEEKAGKKAELTTQAGSLGSIIVDAAPEIVKGIVDKQEEITIGDTPARLKVIYYSEADAAHEVDPGPDVEETVSLIRESPIPDPDVPPEVEGLPYPSRIRLSVSDIMTFTKCPRWFWFEKFLPMRRITEAAEPDAQMDERPEWVVHAVDRARKVGLTVHGVLEKHEGAVLQWDGTGDPPPPLAAAVQAELEAVLKGIPDPDETIPREVVEHLRNAARSDVLRDPLAAAGVERTVLREVPFELEKDDFIITGAIDRVERLADGTWRLMDYKTSSLRERTKEEIVREEAYDVQLQLYTWAAASVLGRKIDSAGVLFTSTSADPFFPVPLPDSLDEAVGGILKRIRGVMDQAIEAFDTVESERHCRACAGAGLGLCGPGRA